MCNLTAFDKKLHINDIFVVEIFAPLLELSQ